MAALMLEGKLDEELEETVTQILYFQFGMRSVSRVHYIFDKQEEAKLRFVFF